MLSRTASSSSPACSSATQVHAVLEARRRARSCGWVTLRCAGVMAPSQRTITPDGMDAQFQVGHPAAAPHAWSLAPLSERAPAQGNYLGHWLLTHTLLEHQLRSRRAVPHELRVVFLSSCTHSGARLDFADLGGLQRGYSALHALQGYCNTKLCAILAAREFQRRFDRHALPSPHAACADLPRPDSRLACRLGRRAGSLQATFCSVHPGPALLDLGALAAERGVSGRADAGMIDTGMARGWLGGRGLPATLQHFLQGFWCSVFPHILLPPEYAVRTMLYAACAPVSQVWCPPAC